LFLIEHSKGRALFDTGLHPDCQRDPPGDSARGSPVYSVSISLPA
jgi:hypothetical protein